MKIFIDVGSHYGETVLEVVKSKYNFDKIFCFEPSKKCLPILNRIAKKDDRVEVLNCGLSDKSYTSKLFDSGSVAASVFEDAGGDPSDDIEEISLLDAGEWFRKNTDDDDVIVVKLNCEGSEVDIIESLLQADEFKKIYNILITFDVRNYSHLRHKEIRTRRELGRLKYNNYCFSDDTMVGSTHQKRINNWLSIFGIDTNISNLADLRSLYYNNFQVYSNKTGYRQRLEGRIKRIFLYEKYPTSLKNIFKSIKKGLRLSRELDT